MVLSDIVTGIQLVKQSVDFIKSSINTAKDVNDIVGAIDNLLGVLAITVFGALLVNAMERGSPSFREWYNGS